jgi:hypothetical protein
MAGFLPAIVIFWLVHRNVLAPATSPLPSFTGSMYE